MTFDPHPMEVVFPGSHPAQLTTLTRRAELVEELGIDVFLVMPFTSDFMKLTPERYIHELLVERLHVVEVVVGENFTFGKKAGGQRRHAAQGRRAVRVRRRGHVAGVRDIAPTDETVTFSSTYIRSCVDAGDVVAAAEALGRPHRVEGVVVRGDGRGKVLGFPTANVAPPMYSAIPADGVYAAWFTVLGPRPGDGHRHARRALSGGGVGRHQPDVLRAAPAPSRRSSSTPRPTCTASTSPSTSSPRIRGQEKFDSVDDLVVAMERRHRAGPRRSCPRQ